MSSELSQASRPLGRYWFDTEFNETPAGIEFISIGLVSDDGREYYAVSNAFDEAAACADPWLKENVIERLGEAGKPANRLSPQAILEGVIAFLGQDRTVELWAYNNAYDVFLLCRLFGGMDVIRSRYDTIEFFDVKQLARSKGSPELPPKGPDHHNALADARWDKMTWEFLNSLPWPH